MRILRQKEINPPTTEPRMENSLVFIDLETTGANFARDRILEVGLVEVSPEGVSEWSTLINPGTPVSSFISGLTGIDDTMVADAPDFSRVAEALHERLRGKCFIAHNARFDYGFLKAEFARLGIEFRATVLCTVKLSRRLSPKAPRHNLDTLIERHSITVDSRHRALADARVLWHLWQAWQKEFGREVFDNAVYSLVRPVSLPEALDPALADELPECAGAYALLDDSGSTLQVGRATNLRSKVLSLFGDGRASRPPINQVRALRWQAAAGEFGARLAEIAYRNAKLTAPSALYAWRLYEHEPGEFRTQLVTADDCNLGLDKDIYGLYNSAREARQALRKLAEAHFLCLRQTGLEATKPGAGCSAVRSRSCRGVCIGKEDVSRHNARLMTALARQKVQVWPHAGPIALVESDEFGMREDFHVFDAWRYLGCARTQDELESILSEKIYKPFDPDIYRCFLKYFQGKGLRLISSLAAVSPAR